MRLAGERRALVRGGVDVRSALRGAHEGEGAKFPGSSCHTIREN